MDIRVLSVIILLPLAAPGVQADPPFAGTAQVDPDVIIGIDPNVYTGIVPTGQGVRIMYDRRIEGFASYNAWLFRASYSDRPVTIELQVNPEFSEVDAAALAEVFAEHIGLLPLAARAGVQTVWIHNGVELFGGGNNNILIHVGQAGLYDLSGILAEVLLHESVHSSLDAAHAASPGWIASQAADGEFISEYAEANPTTEDIAESFLMWFAVRHSAHRLPAATVAIIEQTIPNRIAYFDSQRFEMSPRFVAGHNDTAQWFAAAGCGVERYAFDEDFPGIVGGAGCLVPGGVPGPTIALGPIGSMTVRSFVGAAEECAVRDGSTPSAVSDGHISPGGYMDITLSHPATAFFAQFGSLDLNQRAVIRVFESVDDVQEIGLEATRPSGNVALAIGRGVISEIPFRRVRLSATTPGGAIVVGAFAGLAPGATSLGQVTIPGYGGPAGSTVQFDIAVRFVMNALDEDLNRDGMVNSVDLAVLLGSWGPCQSSVCIGDTDGNGHVNSADLAQVLGSWGSVGFVPCE